MKKILLLLAVLSIGLCSGAKEPRKTEPVKPDYTILLYPQGQNVDRGIVENGVNVTLGPGDSNCESHTLRNDDGTDHYLDEAYIDIYLPKKPNGQMVLICPGGSYWGVSMKNEGSNVANWLTRRGIAACVVKYRMPQGHWTVPLNDVQNAFRYCRAHAKDWGVGQIGIIGFSAGGHLAASASNLYVDNITRPDFSILIYPVITMYEGTHQGTHDNLLGPQEKWYNDEMTVSAYKAGKSKYDELEEHYALERRVTADTPQTFIAMSIDDDVVPVIENGLRYVNSLKRNGVSTEVLCLPDGGHGWGFTTIAECGYDGIAAHRAAFFEALGLWLENIKK